MSKSLFRSDCFIKKRSYKEYGMTFKIANNLSEFEFYKVDDCLISDKNIKKCDLLLIDKLKVISVFVELKGMNLKEAIIQIKNSLFLVDSTIYNKNILAVIVAKRIDQNELKYIDESSLKRFYRKKGISFNLEKRSNTYTYK